MGDDRLFYAFLLLGLLWLGMLLYGLWRRARPTAGSLQLTLAMRATRRSQDPKVFPGLTHKPRCAACEQAAVLGDPVPSVPPPLITSPQGRPRQVDTSTHFCPYPRCQYYGWAGLGNLRANGHPGDGRWRQLQCTACQKYFQETHGTPLHGKCVSPEMLVWAVGVLAEGLGIRAVARVFEVDPNTVLAWLMEVADHAAAFSSCTCTMCASRRCSSMNSLPCCVR